MQHTSEQRDQSWMNPALRLQPGQQKLTPTQEAEGKRFVDAYVQQQFSTELVDEAEATAPLKQAYEAVGLAAPQHIIWVDSPLQLVAAWFPQGLVAVWFPQPSEDAIHNERIMRDRLWETLDASVLDTFPGRNSRDNLLRSVEDCIVETYWDSAWYKAWDGDLERHIRLSLEHSAWISKGGEWNTDIGREVRKSIGASIGAYRQGVDFACYAYLGVAFVPNALQALAQFNALVSGYWLGKEAALVVRRPKRFSLDEEGRPHHATGKCLEYQDGWEVYAWHGVLVPEQVILRPEALTREDFLNQWNVEVRRVIQERMDNRFVPELGGPVIEMGSRGTLYEVKLPGDDPEQVARYVRVQDASSERQYFVRVTPWMETAAEAVAWSFGLAGEEYHPSQET